MSRRIERKKDAAGRVGVSVTTFTEKFVDRGGGDPFVPGTDGKVKRVRPVAMGERWVGFFSDEIDQMIEEIRALRDAASHALPKRAVAAEFHPSRHRKDPNTVVGKRTRKATKETQATV
jgi:hypothetical protein